MNASELMTTAVQSCHADDDLQRAMQIMWDHDCGVVPVVDRDDRVVGMITDRDVAVAAYTQGRALWQIPVSTAMAKKVHGVREADSLDMVEELMRRVRVRRVPVLDAQGKLRGIISLNDLALHLRRGAGRKSDGLGADSIAQTLAAMCEPHTKPVAKRDKPETSSAHLPS
jgi:CBS domain-containing protein